MSTVVLVSCSAGKEEKAMPAEKLYNSDLFKKQLEYAKKLALITVEEILKVVSFYNDSQAEVIYFKEVKQEIEKL